MEVVDGKSEENNGFRGVWIMRDEGMARKTEFSGQTGIRWRLGGQVNKLTDIFSCISYPTGNADMSWKVKDGLWVREDDVEGGDWRISEWDMTCDG